MKILRITLTCLIALLTAQSSLAAQAPNGKVFTYYEDGSKKANKYYKNGTPVGTWETWHNNGKSDIVVNFLGDTGQIERVEARYPSGALMYKGIASIINQENKTTEVGKCSGRTKWHNQYELNFSSYYEDGSCEERYMGNLRRVMAQLYFRLNDLTTGETYDFPWYQLQGTVPNYLKKK